MSRVRGPAEKVLGKHSGEPVPAWKHHGACWGAASGPFCAPATRSPASRTSLPAVWPNFGIEPRLWTSMVAWRRQVRVEGGVPRGGCIQP